MRLMSFIQGDLTCTVDARVLFLSEAERRALGGPPNMTLSDRLATVTTKQLFLKHSFNVSSVCHLVAVNVDKDWTDPHYLRHLCASYISTSIATRCGSWQLAHQGAASTVIKTFPRGSSDFDCISKVRLMRRSLAGYNITATKIIHIEVYVLARL